MNVRILAVAQRELDETVQYYNQQSAGLGDAFLLPYVREFLAFLGITDVQFVYAEGLAISETSKTESLAAAQRSLRSLAQPERIAA